jgi:hypothetical protein
MMRQKSTLAPATVDELPHRSAPCRAPEALILEELDAVVKGSHRQSAVRRALRHTGGAFAKLLARAVPATPPSDVPPEIRFPFF